MAAVIVNGLSSGPIRYDYVTDTLSDWSDVPNDTKFFDKETGEVHYKNLSGNVIGVFESSGVDSVDGLKYYIPGSESQNVQSYRQYLISERMIVGGTFSLENNAQLVLTDNGILDIPLGGIIDNSNGGLIIFQNELSDTSESGGGGSGATGATGSPGSPIYLTGDFIFKPSGVASGRLYTDWSLLWIDVVDTTGPQTIFIDENSGINVIGNYDFQNRITLSARLGVTETILTFENDVTISNLSEVLGSLTLESYNQIQPVYTATSGSSLTFQDGGGMRISSLSGFPMYYADGSGSRNIYFNGSGNALKTNASQDACISANNGATIEVRLQGQKSTITPYAFGTTDVSNLGSRIRLWDYGNPNGLVSKAHPNFTPNGAIHAPRMDREIFNFGGNLLVSNDYAGVNQMPSDTSVSSGVESQAVVGVENQLRQIIWNTEFGDATTEIEIVVTGSVSGAMVYLNTLTGSSGDASIFAFDVGPAYTTKFCVLGDKIEVRWNGNGTAPGMSSFRIT